MEQRYTRTAIWLHWLIAIGIVGTFVLGLYMEGLPFSPDKLKLYSWHKWAGMTLLSLAVLRLIWRATHRPPQFPSAMGPAARALAHAGHAVLYVLMVAIPVSGWLMSSAKGVPVVWFGVLPLPDLVARDKELGDLLQTIHVVLNYTLALAVAGHAGAALLHHFVKKDGVLARMLPPLAGQRS
jgi:cytochrome b561